MSNELGNVNSTQLIIPRGRKNLPALRIDMLDIYKAEDRISDLRLANPMTLPDLITDFNLSIIRLGKVIAAVTLERREAEQELDEATSIAMLDKVDAVLAARNIKSTADTRNAAIVLDLDVKEARVKLDILKTIQELLQNKHQALEMAYYSAKKICDIQLKQPDSTNYGGDEITRRNI